MKKTRLSIKLITIFSYKITKDLLKNGFEIKDIGANTQNPMRTVFAFEDTPEIREFLLKRYGIKLPA